MIITPFFHLLLFGVYLVYLYMATGMPEAGQVRATAIDMCVWWTRWSIKNDIKPRGVCIINVFLLITLFVLLLSVASTMFIHIAYIYIYMIQFLSSLSLSLSCVYPLCLVLLSSSYY